MAGRKPDAMGRMEIYDRAREGLECPGLDELIVDELDELTLRSLLRSPERQVVRAALLRLSQLAPREMDRHLAVYRHCLDAGDIGQAARALDVAEALDPEDRRVLWSRLELAGELSPAELLAIADGYERVFPGDPILAMVRSRCRRELADAAAETVVIPAQRRPAAGPVPAEPVR